jgi:hypothetical protein
MRAALIISPCLALCLALCSACGAPQGRDHDDLAESIRQFNEGVRWGRFAVAASAIPPAQRSQFVDEMDERANDLKITDYEVVRVDPKGGREARVQIKLSWYKASQGTVHETHAVQQWERQGKTWRMVDETRLRGAEMPGLPEPSEPSEPEAQDAPDAQGVQEPPAAAEPVMKD